METLKYNDFVGESRLKFFIMKFRFLQISKSVYFSNFFFNENACLILILTLHLILNIVYLSLSQNFCSCKVGIVLKLSKVKKELEVQLAELESFIGDLFCCCCFTC